MTRSNTFLITAMMMAAASVFGQDAFPVPGASQPTILYGAAYYNEYMPADLQPGRLDKDVALMKAAGITVVRMGESRGSLWERRAGGSSMRGWIALSMLWARPESKSSWARRLIRFLRGWR